MVGRLGDGIEVFVVYGMRKEDCVEVEVFKDAGAEGEAKRTPPSLVITITRWGGRRTSLAPPACSRPVTKLN